MTQNQAKSYWNNLRDRLPRGGGVFNFYGLDGSAGAYAASQIARLHSAPLVLVAQDAKAAENLTRDLELFVGHHGRRAMLSFPAYNIMAYQRMAFHGQTAAQRIRTLYQLIEGGRATITVTTVGALIQKLVPKDALIDYCELLIAGEEIDRDGLVQKLIAGGYTPAVIVEEHGDFSLRGGILDIFSPLYDDPLRIEFFGDLVESIRSFGVDSQRTISQIDEAVITPAREAILRPGQIKALVGRIRTLASQVDMPAARARQLIEQIKHEGLFPGLESLTPLIYPQLDTFFDYAAPTTLFLLYEPARLEAYATDSQARVQDSYQAARDQKNICVAPAKLYLDWDQVKELMRPFARVGFMALAGVLHPTGEGERLKTTVHDCGDVRYAMESAQASQTPLQPLVDWLGAQKEAGRGVLIVCGRPANLDRLRYLLRAYDIWPALIEQMADAVFDRGLIHLIPGTLRNGFLWPEVGLAVITDEEIFGTAYRVRKSSPRPKASELLNFEDLKQDEYVVHAEHGIGRYAGLVKLALNGMVNDFLMIVYRDDDKLYLPVERMNQVQKYMGVEGVEAVVDKMGGKSWERVKRRVKRAAEKIAGELLKLYAARKVQKGHAFGEVDTYFRNFEDGFPFEETADQEKAIAEVLEDMRRPRPMDRLVCGDVGYGKTEVALRAAFLAVSEARQVAVLVPTTVLAEQHFASFKARFEPYQVKVACLSRFRPAREQRQIVAGIQSAEIDIVVGTHRLLSKDIAFKKLGLLVLDEEQRFGVRHKEKIKSMRKTVDVVTLTATPIPRTLHLSLLGIRDISVINTPPEHRRPIVTYITQLDDTIIVEAIRKELARQGQVFFVHNHVQSIQRMAGHLRSLVPEARLAVAHGQMAEERLERVMYDFVKRRINVLVCTTIIESGLDVAAANTMLINRADRFGLAQIYQLRGRVGRSDEQAYAYLFIPHESTLGTAAQKRLKVLMEYSDLGSGFQIAMSDLKIRGGGTILGASQSGHIAAVGYDMFLKLMETTIAKIKGEPFQEALEPEINLPLSAFLPEAYVKDIDQRLSLYRRLAKMADLKAISDFKAEMADRFGPLPEEADNLLLKIMFKVLAVRAGCKRLDLVDTHLRLQFSRAHQARPFGIVEMANQSGARLRLTPEKTLKATLYAASRNALLRQVKNILMEISRRVN